MRIFARLGIYLDLVYLVLRRLPLAAFYGSGPSLAAGIGMGIAPPRRRLPAPGGIATAAGAGAGASSASSVDNTPQDRQSFLFSQSLQSRWWAEMMQVPHRQASARPPPLPSPVVGAPLPATSAPPPPLSPSVSGRDQRSTCSPNTISLQNALHNQPNLTADNLMIC